MTDFDNSKLAHWYGIPVLELEAKPQYLELQAFRCPTVDQLQQLDISRRISWKRYHQM